ncbi:hypothetical protein CQA53_01220 [Helicobacter didelphidarum]|uniref:Uncharacterized protein n=1 Tax=Helicobacter didelphidarum TaxID=2040648 RepID=A0A3D8IST9_9HELI|nr:AAA domain-containing protein [Helicobacter didelphidarum]RDU67651.1 hypothetical protein CQA53_01220 [Helicobacter didelphidarum]
MQGLQQYLIKSATDYLDYLEKNNLGLDEIKIHDVSIRSNNTLFLHLEKNLIGTDYLQLSLGDYNIDLDVIEEKSFNDVTRTLKITFENSMLKNLFEDIYKDVFFSIDEEQTSNIFEILLDTIDKNWRHNLGLFVDLKFLVKNIRDFCQQDIVSIKLPTKKPEKLAISLESFISQEQQEAIRGIFSSPISYIWGISGSGKTQVVLFTSVLNLIAQNKKVLLLAPTNTALEQIFSALITKCDKRGIYRSQFLRLGMPSADFLQNFPEVCMQNEEKEKVEQSNELFRTLTLKERLQDSLVIGATLDSFVKRYQSLSSLDFSHIFLDECAFSPLIKLIIPLSLEIPLTLLGDHKQLMPICLMEDSLIREKNHEVCLWNLNTLFLEEIFNSYQNLYLKSNYDEIKFKEIAYFKLTTTHRYGDNLAKILDRHIYLNGLRGVGLSTQIYYIDSAYLGKQYQYNHGRNESEGEADVIQMLVQSYNFKDYAVLTPFRHQQHLIVRKGVPRNRVFTIHKSQGKEFDMIIFSPVKMSKYLTNSNNKNALFALNVAVSRLKKDLIIVCDYGFWIRQNGQFITSLLQIAKPYPLKQQTQIFTF